MSQTSARELGTLTVLDEQGMAVPVSSLWADKVAVLVFVRHFGWVHCREQAVQLHGRRHDIESTGAVLHIIGNGTPNFIEGFRQKTGYSGTIYTDPSLKTYEACGFLRSVSSTVHPRAILKGLKAFAKGSLQGLPQGDTWQQGGALVVNTEADVLFSYQAREASDNVDPQALLDAIASG